MQDLSTLALDRLKVPLNDEVLLKIQTLDQKLENLPDIDEEIAQEVSLLRCLASNTLVMELNSPEDHKKICLNSWDKANEKLHEFIMNNQPINKKNIITLHDILSNGNSSFRKKNLAGGNCEYPDFRDLEILWEEFDSHVLSKFNEDDEIIEASRLYQWLISLHFFEDANGRLSRLVADWRLSQGGYPTTGFKSDVESFVSVLDKNHPYSPSDSLLKVINSIENLLRKITN